MARAKADNTARDQYAALKAAELAADLISAAEGDAAGADQIILEAVGEASWDDIVLSQNLDIATTAPKNWQVKRQSTTLSRDTMATIFTGLVERQQRASAEHTPVPEFHFGVDTLTEVELHKSRNNRLVVLRDMCSRLRHPALNHQQFRDAANTPETDWLTYVGNVVSLSDPDQVLDLLKLLHVHQLGAEDDIRIRGIQSLTDKYENPDKVFESLYRYLVVNTNPAFRFDYPVLSQEVLANFAKSHKRHSWVRISQAGPNNEWVVRGTIKLSQVVDFTWDANAQPSTLRLELRPSKATEVPEAALVRLIAHRSAATQLELMSQDEWKSRLERLCGGTLGSGPNAKIELGPNHQPTGARSSVSSGNEHPEAIALSLNDQMDQAFDTLIRAKVEAALRDPTAAFGLNVQAELVGMMTAEWARWRSLMDTSKALRTHLYQSLLSTESEWQRRGFDRSVRVGVHNARACAFAIWVGLAVAAVVDGALQLTSAEQAVNLLFNGQRCQLMALEYISNADSGEPIHITYAGSDLTIGHCPLTILAGTQASANDLLAFNEESQRPYSVDGIGTQSFQNLYTGPAVVTAGVDFGHAIRSGAKALQILIATAVKNLATVDVLSDNVDGSAFYV